MLAFLRRWFGTGESRSKDALEGEDPAVAVERTLGTLERELAEAGESLRAVAAIRRDLEMRRTRADETVARHAGQAERAMALGREDLAREALDSEATAKRLEEQVVDLEAQATRDEEAARQAVLADEARARSILERRESVLEQAERLRESVRGLRQDTQRMDDLQRQLEIQEQELEAGLARARLGSLEREIRGDSTRRG